MKKRGREMKKRKTGKKIGRRSGRRGRKNTFARRHSSEFCNERNANSRKISVTQKTTELGQQNL